MCRSEHVWAIRRFPRGGSLKNGPPNPGPRESEPPSLDVAFPLGHRELGTILKIFVVSYLHSLREGWIS